MKKESQQKRGRIILELNKVDKVPLNQCICGYQNKRFLGKYCTMSCYYKHKGLI